MQYNCHDIFFVAAKIKLQSSHSLYFWVCLSPAPGRDNFYFDFDVDLDVDFDFDFDVDFDVDFDFEFDFGFDLDVASDFILQNEI